MLYSTTFLTSPCRPDVRKWWLDTCLNATSFANRDGCFCDASQRTGAIMKSQPSPRQSKLDAWSEGLTALIREVQEALGDDRLLMHWQGGKSIIIPVCQLFLKLSRLRTLLEQQ